MYWFIFAILVVSAVCAKSDGGKAPRLPLNDGRSIPNMGLGTFLGFNEQGQIMPKGTEVEDAVSWGLQAGYRLIDTATVYKNEDQVGKAVRKSNIPREDIFVVTKLSSSEQRDVEGALRNSLNRLEMDYVDLYLIHSPVAFKPDFSGFDVIDYVDTWKQMEKVKKLGLAKSIGLSNFNQSQIERLMEHSEVKPAVLQVEVNLNLAQSRLIDFCKSKNIVMMAYTPFGSLFSKDSKPPAPRANDPALTALADKYKKTVPQIVLRYLIQKGVVPIPKSVQKERIEENIDVFDFELSPQDMDTLGKFNKDYRVVFPTYWQEHPYYPYEKQDIQQPNPFKPKGDKKN